MPAYKFKSHLRLAEFWENRKGFPFRSPAFLFYLLGWVFAFCALLLTLQTSIPGILVMLIIAGYFWHKSIGNVSRQLNPPVELILLLLLVSYALQYGWFHLFMGTSRFEISGGVPAGILPTLLQVFILWLQITLFTLILTLNRPKQIGTLIFYTLLTVIALYPLQLSDRIFWQIFQVLLFLLLFRQTSWVEKLTRIECWIYLGTFLILYLNFETLPYRVFSEFTAQSMIWYFLPKLLSHLFNLLLLAILIKIPFVLVYHHASLHRKLQIAGWLQSSIPQFIQLIILLMVFYFFIASWQAENLNTSLQRIMNSVDTGYPATVMNHFRQEFQALPAQIELPGIQPLQLPAHLPRYGVIQLFPSRSSLAGEYFLFFDSDNREKPAIHFVKLDTLFLDALRREFNPIAANGILSYPFTLEQWDSVLYKIRGWENSDQNRSFRVFPFALIPESSPHTTFISLFNPETGESLPLNRGRVKIMNQDIFTAGRLYTDLYNSSFQKTGSWALDIVVVPDFSFFKSRIFRQFLFWLFIYFLINLMVIQRVIKFGQRITQIILQKFNQLTQGIRQISSGNLEYQISMEGEDEFMELAERFNQMGNDLQKKISEVREKDRLEYELRIARDVQLSLLPQTLPAIPGYQLGATIQTATEVGGDFYDVLQLDENTFLLVIGDVSGKGTSAAFYMAQCISLIRFARQFSADPKEIILRLNRYFSDPMIDKQVFITAVIGLLDVRKHQITLYRTGHNLPIHIPANQDEPISEIKSTGLGIGLERNGKIFEQTLKGKLVKFKPGDVLFLYTDGIADAASIAADVGDIHSGIRFFGEERLLGLLEKIRGYHPQLIQQNLLAELRAFYGNSPLLDDMTMLIIQRSER